MPAGKVTKYFADRAFGFLAPDGGDAPLFFHLTQCDQKIAPEIGARVSFALSTDRAGRPVAVNVRPEK
jgi:cold shock CspA family protein